MKKVILTPKLAEKIVDLDYIKKWAEKHGTIKTLNQLIKESKN